MKTLICHTTNNMTNSFWVNKYLVGWSTKHITHLHFAASNIYDDVVGGTSLNFGYAVRVMFSGIYSTESAA